MKAITAAALRVLEDCGMPPLPCDDNKRPLEANWTAKVYRDYQSVEDAFERTSAKLIGVLTGAPSGYFVVDVDPSGAQWFADHIADLAPGFMYTTRRANGRHLWYRVPDGWSISNSTNKLAGGIDTRGTGGQAIWWPEHGGTVLADDGAREPSEWLLSELKRVGAARRQDEARPQAAPPGANGRQHNKQGEGGRNDMLTRLAGSMRRAGFAIESIREALHKENYVRCEPPLPGSEVEGILSQAEKWEGGEEHAQGAAIAHRAPLLWLDLMTKEPAPRQWVIPHWIPAGHLTLLAGRGGIGKTLLAQHLASAIALGRSYLEEIEPKRVLMWACEDDHDELWRRQIAINNLLATPFDKLEGKFYLHSYAGADVTLMAPAFGALERRPMLEELAAQVRDYKADIVLLDNIARLYGGNENDRHSVTTFCALVQGACAPAAVLLIGHPSKQPGSEFSGSTAWEGAVRARLYFSDRMPDAPVDDDEAPVDDTVRYLSRRKANYSALDVRRFSLSDGILVPESIERARGQSVGFSGDYAKDVVRRAIRTLAERGIFGALSTASQNYLPKLAKQYGLLDRASEKQFGAVMRAMILEGTIASEKVGTYSNRTDKFGIVLK